MDIFEIRRQRLELLIKDRCEGKISICATRLGRSQSYVGRLLYPEGKPGKRRIAHGMITVIENAFSLPRGWLDGIEPAEYLAGVSKGWANLTPAQQQAVLALIEALAADPVFSHPTHRPAIQDKTPAEAGAGQPPLLDVKRQSATMLPFRRTDLPAAFIDRRGQDRRARERRQSSI